MVFGRLHDSNGGAGTESVQGYNSMQQASSMGPTAVVLVKGPPVAAPATRAAVLALTARLEKVPDVTGAVNAYTGPADRAHAIASAAATAQNLARWMAARGVITGQPAAAQDANAIVVTSAAAARYRLRTVSDLAGVASRLVFGGPPECPERPDCLPGLRRVYALWFRTFVALDAGGPLTRQALEAGDIGMALLFTTSVSCQSVLPLRLG